MHAESDAGAAYGTEIMPTSHLGHCAVSFPAPDRDLTLSGFRQFRQNTYLS